MKYKKNNKIKWRDDGEISIIIDIDIKLHQYRILYDDSSKGWMDFEWIEAATTLVEEGNSHPHTNIFK